MLNTNLVLVPVALVAVIAVVLIIILGYVKAPPDTALIISGMRKQPKVLIGKAGFKIPYFERLDRLSLKLIPLDIKSGDAVPTADCINILVDSAVNVKIGSTPEMVAVAAQNFLNKNTREVGDIVSEVLEGNIREIICTMKLRELIGDRKKFVEKVSENVVPDLQKMGLELVSFNVQKFSDENHVINDLGIDNISQIKKDAAIAKANADKEVEIAKAKADKEANDARVQSETEIAVKQNELAIKKSALKKDADIKQAEADAAYAIQKEVQRKTIEETTANANLVRQEKAIVIQSKNVELKERELEADIMKQADADKYAVQKRADAELYEQQKQAEAELYNRQKKAEAAKYEKEKESEAIKAVGLAEAEAIAAKGRAEAKAIQAKAEAEAIGILKKAEAMKQYGDAAIEQMQLDTAKAYFEQLPKIAEAIGSGYAKVDSIKIFGGESSQLAGNIVNTLTQVTDGIKESSGIDISALLAGYLGGKISSPSPDAVEVNE